MTELARVDVEQRDDLCLVRLQGEIDISNAHELSDRIQESIPNGAATVVIDLAGTTYLDSAGVQLMFTLVGRLKMRRQRIRVAVPKGNPVRAVLEISGLPRVVEVDPPADEGEPEG